MNEMEHFTVAILEKNLVTEIWPMLSVENWVAKSDKPSTKTIPSIINGAQSICMKKGFCDKQIDYYIKCTRRSMITLNFVNACLSKYINK